MPTGYTYEVADGTVADFRTFALRCARAFGATVMQRDESMDAPPRRREPSDYHEGALRAAEDRLIWVMGLSPDGARSEMEREHVEALAGIERWRADKALKRARYEAMRAEVDAWKPPTPEHGDVKRFMLEQLASSIEADCSDWEPDAPAEQTVDKWLTAKREQAEKNVRYHTDELAKEIARCAEANAWIDALYASLPAPTAVQS